VLSSKVRLAGVQLFTAGVVIGVRWNDDLLLDLSGITAKGPSSSNWSAALLASPLVITFSGHLFTVRPQRAVFLRTNHKHADSKWGVLFP
jgi:hypothetical protein